MRLASLIMLLLLASTAFAARDRFSIHFDRIQVVQTSSDTLMYITLANNGEKELDDTVISVVVEDYYSGRIGRRDLRRGDKETVTIVLPQLSPGWHLARIMGHAHGERRITHRPFFII